MNIIFRGYDAYGDWISLNSFVRFLLSYYDKIYLITKIPNFVKDLFHDNDKIIVGFNESDYKEDEIYDEINVEIWEHQVKNYNFTKNSYDSRNPIGPFLGFERINVNVFDAINKSSQFIFKEEAKILENNSSAFYVALGIPASVKLDNFFYKRDHIIEDELYQKLDLDGKNYIVICDYEPFNIKKEYYENKNYLNIHNISKLFDIFKIIENSDEVHLIENSIALLIYHMQFKKLLKNTKVYLHAYSRSEHFRKAYSPEQSNIFVDMFIYPKLDNWEIIF